jgi:hypothetical protein
VRSLGEEARVRWCGLKKKIIFFFFFFFFAGQPPLVSSCRATNEEKCDGEAFMLICWYMRNLLVYMS